MAYHEDDPFKDENRPPLPELSGGSGFDYKQNPDESDEEYGKRYGKFLEDKLAPPKPPDSPDYLGTAGSGESTSLLDILEEVRRIKEILEELLP